MQRVSALWLGLIVFCHHDCGLGSALKRDESIVVPPAVAWLSETSSVWEAEIKVWVFEQERRPLAVAGLRQGLRWSGTQMTEAELAALRSRARWFMVDSERGKDLGCRLGGTFHRLNPTAGDGWSQTGLCFTKMNLPPAAYQTGAPVRTQWELESPRGASSVAYGDLWLIPPAGLSVISDIDDTIKISNVRDRNLMLKRTFLKDFEPVPGMADLYDRINASNNVAFHYVSGSPWPLFVSLQEFCRTNGFPPGSFHLRDFRWRKGPLQRLLGPTERHKIPVIEALFRAWPRRKFIAVGDSGESDPEIYGVMARAFPDQIERIYIRNVTKEDGRSRRYAKAFEGVPTKLWVVFEDPGGLQPIIPQPGSLETR